MTSDVLILISDTKLCAYEIWASKAVNPTIFPRKPVYTKNRPSCTPCFSFLTPPVDWRPGPLFLENAQGDEDCFRLTEFITVVLYHVDNQVFFLLTPEEVDLAVRRVVDKAIPSCVIFNPFIAVVRQTRPD